MAESNYEGIVTSKEYFLDGHIGSFKFMVNRLDVINGIFGPLEYNTECQSIPTSWRMEMNYKKMPDVDDFYTFSVHLKRTDSLYHRVKASLDVSFKDIYDKSCFLPISLEKDRIIRDEELFGTSDGILPSILRELVTVEVEITIKNCHDGLDWKCASKVKTHKHSVNVSKL